MEQHNPTATVAFDLLASEVEHLQRMVDILAGWPSTPATGENDSLGKPGTPRSGEPASVGKPHTTLSGQDYTALTAEIAHLLHHIHILAGKPGTT